MYQHPHLYIRTSQAFKKPTKSSAGFFPHFNVNFVSYAKALGRPKKHMVFSTTFQVRQLFPNQPWIPGGSPWDRGNYHMGPPPWYQKVEAPFVFFSGMLGGSLFHGIYWESLILTHLQYKHILFILGPLV